jgi:hypothetical protein
LRKDRAQLFVIPYSCPQFAKIASALGNPIHLPHLQIGQMQLFGGKHQVPSNDRRSEEKCEHQAALDKDTVTSSYDPINAGSMTLALRENRHGSSICLVGSWT